VALFAKGGSRVRALGESLLVGPRQGLALGLILHELVTNAARYGALAGPAGEVEVRWAKEGERVRLRWEERDGPPVAAPPAEGFGLELIRRSASYDLGGKAECNFAPEGVRWDVIFPH
jgi:two-component system CheB/CheR fusion protein